MSRWIAAASIITVVIAAGGCGQQDVSERRVDGPATVSVASANLDEGEAASYSGLLHHVYGPNRETTGFAVDQGRQRVEVDLRTMGEDPMQWANQLVAIQGYWTVVHGEFLPNRWIVVATGIDQMHPDLSCAGPSHDGTKNYDVLVIKDAAGKYARVILQQSAPEPAADPATMGDYDQFQDVTPPPPSDVSFRGIFGLPTPTTGDFIITLTDGGFTHMAVVEVKEVTDSGNTVVGNMTCAPPLPSS